MQRVRARQEQPLHSRLYINQAFPSLPNHRGSGMASTLRFHPSSGRKADERRKSMLGILSFVRKWKHWYCVLRYGKGFGTLDSVRYALWLARG